MAHGVVTPLARIVGPTDVEIAGAVIPAGVSDEPSRPSLRWKKSCKDGCFSGRHNCAPQPRDIPRPNCLWPREMATRGLARSRQISCSVFQGATHLFGHQVGVQICCCVCVAELMFPLASLGVNFILLLAPSSENWIWLPTTRRMSLSVT